LTNDIPNVSEEATKDLDENGMIRIEPRLPGDILIKKLPKGNQILLRREIVVQSSIKQVM
jgi:DNA-directed RNA polymerase beta subunit